MVCGWTVGLFFAVMGLSGSLLVCHDRMYAALNRSLTTASAPYRVGGKAAETMLLSAQGRHPGWHVLQLDCSAQSAWAFYVSPRDWDAESQIRVDYFDPGSGRFLGERGLRQGFLNWLLQFHTNLLRGSKGTAILVTMAVFTLILVVTGVTVWWRGVERWASFGITRGARWPRKNWDLHRLIGFFTSWWLMLQAATALTLLLPALAYLVLPRTVPGSAADLRQFDATPSVPDSQTLSVRLPLDTLIARVDAQHPHLRLESINFPVDRDASVLIAMGGSRFDSRGEQARVAIDPYNGSVLSDMNTASGPAALRVYAALASWHFGHLAGAFSRALWIALGLTPAVLFVTGILMWWMRFGKHQLSRLFRRKERVL